MTPTIFNTSKTSGTPFKMEWFNLGMGSERWVEYRTAEYSDPTFKRLFVARFKYGKAGSYAKHFVNFLVKNFSVEEYFTKLNDSSNTPLGILKAKGYVTPQEKRLNKKLAEMGISRREYFDRMFK